MSSDMLKTAISWWSAPLFEAAVHAGLIIVLPNVGRTLQQQLFSAALSELAIIGDPVNRVIEVDLDGAEVTVDVYDLPSRKP